MFHYLGLLLIVFSWIVGTYLVFKWRDKNLLTISKHAASSRQASLLFGATLIVGGLVFYWWLLTWFRPHLGLSWIFTSLLTFTIACQLITGALPDTAGLVRRIHRTSAYTMAVSYLPLALSIIAAPKISFVARLLCEILGTYMLFSFITVVILKKAHNWYLLFQALYVVAMQVIILVAAYIEG